MIDNDSLERQQSEACLLVNNAGQHLGTSVLTVRRTTTTTCVRVAASSRSLLFRLITLLIVKSLIILRLRFHLRITIGPYV